MPIPGSCDRALFWFRRDLRDCGNACLCHALKSSRKVFCAFIFDREILDELPSSADRRVEFIWESVNELRTALENRGGSLIVRHVRSSEAIPQPAAELNVNTVFTSNAPVQHTSRAPVTATTPSRHLGWLGRPRPATRRRHMPASGKVFGSEEPPASGAMIRVVI